jgi:hypothetical protein
MPALVSITEPGRRSRHVRKGQAGVTAVRFILVARDKFGRQIDLSLQRLRFTPPRGLDLSEEAGDTLCEVFCPTH